MLNQRCRTAIALLLVGCVVQCGGTLRSSEASDASPSGAPGNDTSNEPGATNPGVGVPSPGTTTSGPATPSDAGGRTIDAAITPPALPGPGAVLIDADPPPLMPPLGCPGWSEDLLFSSLSSQGQSLVRPYAAWGSSDSDIHIAMGSSDASSPPQTAVTAVAHWNGSQWTVDPLKGVRSIAAISGTSAQNLWVLSAEVGSPAMILRNKNGGIWASALLPLGFGAAFDLVVLGPERALMSARPDYNLIKPGSILIDNLGSWAPMQLPPDNEPYTPMKLSARDEKHGYAIGYATGGQMGNHVLAAFDGTVWTSVQAPGAGTPAAIAIDAVASTPGHVYAASISGGSRPVNRLYEISEDLRSWKAIAQVLGDHDTGAVVATTAGTVVGIWSNSIAIGIPATIVVDRGSTITACALATLGRVVAVAPPGSPNVHVFATEPSANQQGAHHWVLHVDP